MLRAETQFDKPIVGNQDEKQSSGRCFSIAMRHFENYESMQFDHNGDLIIDKSLQWWSEQLVIESEGSNLKIIAILALVQTKKGTEAPKVRTS